MWVWPVEGPINFTCIFTKRGCVKCINRSMLSKSICQQVSIKIYYLHQHEGLTVLHGQSHYFPRSSISQNMGQGRHDGDDIEKTACRSWK